MAPAGNDLLSTLVHIQGNLDKNLSLAVLARHAGLSASHFHRVFTARVGETPKAYTLRLRLERAALQLWLRRTTVLRAALEVGFQTHETFTRAFRRRFGIRPSDVQQEGIGALASSMPRRAGEGAADSLAGTYELSVTRIATLRPMDLAFMRHVGPYEAVPPALFDNVQRWVDSRSGAAYRPLLGIGQDAPGVTPPDRLRFDACVVMDGPFEEDDQVGHQRLPEGRYAVTTHVGHYSTLPDAYAKIFERLLELPAHHPAGPPAIEMYHESRVDADLWFNHTDIYLPVIPKAESTAQSNPGGPV